MKSEQAIKRGAVGTAPAGLAGIAGRILTGAVALLLISGAFSTGWAITGGQVDTNNMYPNVCAYVAQPTNGSPIFIGASGTLIHPRVILTAGHVAYGIEQNPWPLATFPMSFGTYAFDPTTYREIETAISHPRYNPIAYASEQSYDVGVIILKEPIYDLPLGKLPSASLLDKLEQAGLLRQPGQGGAAFRVVGYGQTLDWAPKVYTDGDGWRRFGDSEYLALQQQYLQLSVNPAIGNGGVAPGDSGGPVFCTDLDGTCVVVGVASQGMGTGISRHSRVDLPETLNFINWVIKEVNEGRL